MKQARIGILLVLAAVGGAIGTLSVDRWATRSVTAESAEPQSEPLNKWEYCMVSRASYANSPRANVWWITYFSAAGMKVVDVEDNFTSNAPMSKAFARVGSEGYELVIQGTVEVKREKLDAWYFKRPATGKD